MVNLENIPKKYASKIKQTTADFLKKEAINPQAVVNVYYISKKRIRALNKKYRQIDEATDVLSFPIWEKSDVIPKNGQVALGDIFICPEATKIDQNLENLLGHSLNHLIGKHH